MLYCVERESKNKSKKMFDERKEMKLDIINVKN
jgi:hypothetical protein